MYRAKIVKEVKRLGEWYGNTIWFEFAIDLKNAVSVAVEILQEHITHIA